MPVISARVSKGDGKYKPLPKGTYDVTINEVKESVSKNNNQTIRLIGAVADGEYSGKVCNVFYTLTPQGGWKIKLLLDAAGVEYTEVDLDDVDEDGNPMTAVQFDTDELVGKTVRYDVAIRQYNGNENNDFSKERAIEAAPAQAQNAAPATTKPAAQAAPAQRQPAQAQARTATPSGRSVR